MILEMLHVLEGIHSNELNGARIYKYCDALQEGVRPKKYQPLLSRSKCSKSEIQTNSIDLFDLI